MSQSSSEKKTIDGVEYEVFMLDVETAHKTLIKLAKSSLPSVGALVETGGLERLLDSDIQEVGVGGALSRLAKDINHDLLWGVIRDLAEVTTVIGKGKLSTLMATHFHGRLAHMYKWLAFALTVQYRDFSDVFETLRAAIPNTAAPTPAAQE
jgi:hypothetical protein